MRKTYTPNEVAQMIGCTRTNIIHHIVVSGKLRATKVMGRWQIAAGDLRAFAKANNVVLRASGSPAGAR